MTDNTEPTGLPEIQAPVLPAAVPIDRAALLYLMQQFDAETWQCPQCGHAEDTATMDSANYLRRYLAENPAAAAPTPAAPGIDLAERVLSALIEEGVLGRNGRVFQKIRAMIDASPKGDHFVGVNKMVQDSPKGGSDALQIPDTEGVREILGRMCFQCIRLAQVLRLRGDEIKERAEDEQAAVLRFLLNHYLASPDQWAEHAQAEIDAIRKQPTSAEVGS